MVKVETLKINQHSFVCVTLVLPGLTTRLIYCTGGILFDDCWRLETVETRCRVPVCIGRGKSFEAMLQNKVVQCSKKSADKGIKTGQTGSEVLLKMIHEN